MRDPILKILIFAMLILGLFACGNDDNEGADGDSPDGDLISDGDAIDGDVEIELEVDAESEEASGCVTPDAMIEDTPDLEQKKFALSMFHYNAQYVAGGLETEIDGEMFGLCDSPCLGWTDERLIDWIITFTFEPVLDLYAAHPGWRGTLEMQALMLEAIGERHPAILLKLQEAAQAGRVEIVSFHYSDQLFLAFPERDLDYSIQMTKEIFDRYCVPLSAVVFNQEGQAGIGRHPMMKKHGYEIAVFPKNLYNYVRNGEARWPYYKENGIDVIIGPGEVDPASGIDVAWTFFDDGELLAFFADPYFAPFSKEEGREERMVEYEAELTALEEDGYKITSIKDYVNHLKAQDIEQLELPPVVDGTWQPTSTSSVLRWMGGRSQAPYNNIERDNLIRTTNYRIGIELEAAQILLNEALALGLETGDVRERLAEGRRQLYLAEVTDATGITPWIGELNYAFAYNEGAKALAEEAVAELLPLLDWPHAAIDFETGAATMIEDIPMPEAPAPTEAPLEVSITAPTRETGLSWFSLGENKFELQVEIGAAADPTGKDQENCIVKLDFPRSEDKIIYSPALMEETVRSYDFDEFSFQTGEIYLTLSNGLIGLGDNWWVIKDTRIVHIAARVPNAAAEDIIQFIDETADPVTGAFWRFVVFQGSQAEALALARRMNTHPLVFK